MLTFSDDSRNYITSSKGEKYLLLPSVSLPEDEYGPSAFLGKGEFGTVSIAINRHGLPFAVKTIDIDKGNASYKKNIAEVEKEFGIMRHLGWHVDMVQPEEQPSPNMTRIYVLQPFIPGRSLQSYFNSLKEKALLPEIKDNDLAKLKLTIQAVNSFIAACEATKLLHERNVIHGDLHPGNILYDVNRNQARVIDFGMSCVLAPGENKLYVPGDAEVANYHRAPETVTARQLRPGKALERVYDKSTDVFSLAISCGVISDILDYAPEIAGKEIAQLLSLFKDMSQSEFLSGNSRPQDRISLELAIIRLKEIQHSLDLRLAQKYIFDSVPQLKTLASEFKKINKLKLQTKELGLPDTIYEDFLRHSALIHSQDNIIPTPRSNERSKAITTQRELTSSQNEIQNSQTNNVLSTSSTPRRDPKAKL